MKICIDEPRRKQKRSEIPENLRDYVIQCTRKGINSIAPTIEVSACRTLHRKTKSLAAQKKWFVLQAIDKNLL
jgi:hypothetical protein